MTGGIEGLRQGVLVAGAILCLGLAVVEGGQSSPPALSAVQRAHLKQDRFAIVTSIRGLPLGVRESLQTLFGSGSLDIAEPGARFRAKATDDATLPSRRLIAAGCANDQHCLVYYERGGATHTWHALLFQWTPGATEFEWGGAAPSGLATVGDVRNAILSGSVKAAAAQAW